VHPEDLEDAPRVVEEADACQVGLIVVGAEQAAFVSYRRLRVPVMFVPPPADAEVG
jgi:hypothetical protein